MSEIRKKAMTRLVLCAVALVASIIFSVLLLSGTLDGTTGGSKPASGDTISSSAPVEGVDDPTADNFTAESTPAEEAPAEPEATPEPTPEPTPVPEYEGLSVQPTTYYNEGEQPTYTVTDGNNLNMRSGPGTESGGTGIGLSIARWAAQLHGGTVRVVDDPRGADFEIVLPKYHIADDEPATDGSARALL